MATDLSPVKAYLRAVALIFPALLGWGFSRVFLLPKLEEVWEESGIAAPNAVALMKFTSAGFHHVYLILFGICALVVVLENFVKPWKKFRSLTLDVLIFFSYVFIVVWFIAMTICALLAVSVVQVQSAS